MGFIVIGNDESIIFMVFKWNLNKELDGVEFYYGYCIIVEFF